MNDSAAMVHYTRTICAELKRIADALERLDRKVGRILAPTDATSVATSAPEADVMETSYPNDEF